MSDEAPIRNLKSQVLSDDWSVLTKHTFEYRRRDGRWETQVRQAYNRGDGAAVLPYDPERGTVLLVRQFRLPVYLNGHPEPLIEVCAGKLDDADPEACIRKEAQEELGYRLGPLTCVFNLFMSPGSVTERLALFVGPYSAADRIGEGGGDPGEGEDIEVLEMPLSQAVEMVDCGEICDGKTVALIQHLALKGLPAV